MVLPIYVSSGWVQQHLFSTNAVSRFPGLTSLKKVLDFIHLMTTLQTAFPPPKDSGIHDTYY